MRFSIGSREAPETGLFNDHERRRMFMLCGLVVVVASVFVVSLNKETDRRRDTDIAVEDETPRVIVSTPEVDAELLRELADDSTPEARVLIGTPALEAVFESARLLRPQHYVPMNGRLIDRRIVEQLLADPDPERGNLFRIRGWIEEFVPFDAIPGSTAHYRGRLRAEDGSTAYFATLSLNDLRGEIGEFAVLDGLFLENHRREGPESWIDAPLLVASRMTLSFPELDPVRDLNPNSFIGVQDDSVSSITGQPFHEYWKLVSFVQHLDDYDWSTAPVLDADTYGELRAKGSAWRARPIRVPASEVMDISSQAQKENPLRLETLTEGWIGNWDWMKPGNGLVRFVGPFTDEVLQRGDIAEARGFFLRHSAYEMNDGSIGIVPLLVLHSIEGYTPEEDNSWTIILAMLGGSILVFTCLVGLALLRDRRKSKALQVELVRRRRARRAQPQS